jgi:hypothetical protein
VRGLLLIPFLCLSASADGVYRHNVTPYRRIVNLTWHHIPYSHTPGWLFWRDGHSYELHNPTGVACEPCYMPGQEFECHVTVYQDRAMVIDAGRLAE